MQSTRFVRDVPKNRCLGFTQGGLSVTPQQAVRAIAVSKNVGYACGSITTLFNLNATIAVLISPAHPEPALAFWPMSRRLVNLRPEPCPCNLRNVHNIKLLLGVQVRFTEKVVRCGKDFSREFRATVSQGAVDSRPNRNVCFAISILIIDEQNSPASQFLRFASRTDLAGPQFGTSANRSNKIERHPCRGILTNDP